MPKIGVLLSGCGVYDGSEIHEAVITLLSINKAGAETICMAPDIEFSVVNHITKKPTGEKRNVLVEAARIARGNIKDIKEISSSDIDALILPGGYGAACNLSDFASKGANATVNNEVNRLLQEMKDANKPIGAICIAPVTVAKALCKVKPEVTIGKDTGTASAINSTGAKHKICPVNDIVVDTKNNIVTTPAYMLGPEIKDIAIGIEKLVTEVIHRIK